MQIRRVPQSARKAGPIENAIIFFRSIYATLRISVPTIYEVYRGDYRRADGDAVTIRDNRVPWLVKLAGSSEAVSSSQPADLLRIHDLTLEILSGRIVTPDQVVEWLTRG